MIFEKPKRIRRFQPEEIRQIRRYLNETRPEFAYRFWVSHETIKSWETGRRNPDGPSLILLSHYEKEANERRAEKNRVVAKSLGMNV